jgi:hypothetical protein
VRRTYGIAPLLQSDSLQARAMMMHCHRMRAINIAESKTVSLKCAMIACELRWRAF